MLELKIILLGAGALALIIIVWAIILYLSGPNIEEPDGKARITGSCGDTMEIYLKFKDGKVVDSSCWTDGCTYSYNCVVAAAEMAKGKSPEEILQIDAQKIQDYIGGLPKDHMHCAKLAEETLQAALEDYMKKLVQMQKKTKRKSKS